jgi:transposase
MRAVMNGVMYILSTGCQWLYLPKDFPPRSTIHNYFIWWQCDGVLDRIHHPRSSGDGSISIRAHHIVAGMPSETVQASLLFQTCK